MSGPTLGSDGVWYAGSRPVAVSRGRWRRGAAWLGRALKAPFVWVGSTGKRAITSLPWVAGGPQPSAVTGDNAIRLIPLFACVRILADGVASLPLQAYRKDGDRREQLTTTPRLVDKPSARDDLFRWLHKCVVSLALRGNAYGLIVARDGFGYPTMIEWLNPDDVFVDEQRPTLPVFYWMGHKVPTEDIVHVPWFVLPGKVVGLSPVAAFASTIGVGLSATQYGARWFDNGGTPPGVMKNTTKTLNGPEAEQVSDRLMARIRAGKPLVVGSDWDFTALKVSPEESQFIETTKMNATQIAAIYGVSPEKVGGEAGGPLTYNTVELNQLADQGNLRPWLVRLEAAFSALVPERTYLKFNADAMVRTSLLDRYKAHSLALADGWRNRDEVRAIEDLPPIPGGEGQAFNTDGGRPPTTGTENQ